MSETGAQDAEAVRADVWLWRARLFKSRSGAGRFIRAGRVRLQRGPGTRRLARPSATVRPGDVLTYARNARIICVRVVAPGARRGPPAEAALLYERVETAQEQV